MTRRARCVVVLSLGLAAGRVAGAQPVPAGVELQVNTYTSNYQEAPAIAADGLGRFVVVWQGDDQDGDQEGIFGQRFAADGSRLGGEFQVNTVTTHRQASPSVAADATGHFVVVWRSMHSADPEIRGQLFDSDATPRGDELQISASTTDLLLPGSVAMDDGGAFVVVWGSERDSFGYGIHGRRFSRDGSALGDPFPINTSTAGSRRGPAVAAAGDGAFVVAWGGHSDGPGDGYDAVGRRYAADGSALGGEFLINSYLTGNQGVPDVAIDDSGNFVAVWASFEQDGDVMGVYGQRFDSDGSPVGGEFQVNSYTTSMQWHSHLAVDPAGNFVVAWSSFGQDGYWYGVHAQHFSAGGAKLGEEFQVNTYTAGSQTHPAAASGPDGGFVVVWRSGDFFVTQDGSGSGVFGQRYRLPQVFADGFESGDTSAWSSRFGFSARPPAAAARHRGRPP